MEAEHFKIPPPVPFLEEKFQFYVEYLKILDDANRSPSISSLRGPSQPFKPGADYKPAITRRDSLPT